MENRWMQRAAHAAAWLLLINGLLGLGVGLWRAPAAGVVALLPWLSVLGVVAGALSVRRQRAGAWGGVVFYALQLASYYPYAGGWSFGYKAGLSLAYVARLPDGVLVVNAAALLLLALSVLLATATSRAR